MLKIRHISKTFNPGTINEKRAITDLSLELKKGDFATIIGSNGAGKSTLFNAICGDFFQIPVLSNWMAEILRLHHSMQEPEASGDFIRIPCVEQLLE